jgi:hypothetical protein
MDCGWTGERKEECKGRLLEWQDRDAGRKMEKHSQSRSARAAGRSARLAAKDVAGDREPTWDNEGNPVLHSEG